MGLVLGGQLEANFFRAYRLGHRTFSVFFESPIALAVWGLMLITLLSPLIRSLLEARERKRASKDALTAETLPNETLPAGAFAKAASAPGAGAAAK